MDILGAAFPDYAICFLDGGQIQHVLSAKRGHNREPCFFGEEDYSSYLHWLGVYDLLVKTAKKKFRYEA